MNTNLVTLVLASSAGISALAILAALLIAFVNRRKSSRAAKLVWLALGINIFLRVGGWLFNFLMTQWYSPAVYGSKLVYLQPIYAILGATSLILLVYAVFVDRETRHPETRTDYEGAIPIGDGNPYSAPR